MPQPYFVKGLIGKVLAYGGLQIRNIFRTDYKSLRTRMLFLFINSILTSNFLLYIYKLPTFVTYLTYY